MAKKKPSTKLKTDQFMVWVTLPKSTRPKLREAAGKMDMPMSEFARKAVLEAIRKVESGETIFVEESS